MSQQSTVSPSQFYFNVSNLDGGEARGKLRYISREDENEQAKGREQVPVHNRAGRPMDEDEKEAFLEHAEKHDYCQRWQISPPNGDDLSRDEIRRETRRVVDDRTRDMGSSRVAFSVHTDQESPNHAHVLVAGNESELRMNRADIDRTRTNAHERMTANERYRDRQQENENDNEQGQENEQQQARGRDAGAGRGR